MPRFVSEPFPCETYRGIKPIGRLGRSAPARIHLAGALFCFRCRESCVRQRAAGSLRRGTAGAELPVCEKLYPTRHGPAGLDAIIKVDTEG